MLEMRFLRTGRRNRAFFRIVLTEKSKPAKSGFIKILGWYDPQTKESSFDKEEILSWANKGAWASNSLARLLNENKIEHKCIKYKQLTPKKTKKEPVVKAEKQPAQPEVAPEGIQDETVSQEVEEKVEEEIVEPTPEMTPETDEKEEVANEAVAQETTEEVVSQTEEDIKLDQKDSK
jgi:small subunit ribosomal protein S16